MKYTWVSLAIVAIWFLSALVVIARHASSPETVFSIAAFGTIVLALLGFRTPKVY